MTTRPSYLEAYVDVIPKAQQERLLQVLKSKFDSAGITPDDTSLEDQLKKMVAELEKPLGEPSTQYRPATKYGKIVSKDYNTTMDEVFVDLGALYSQDNLIDSVIIKHELLNRATLEDVRAALRRIKSDVEVNVIVKENKSGITDAKFNDFFVDDNQSKDQIFNAWVDADTNKCKLPPGLNQSVLSTQGLAMADIYLTHYGGGVRGTISSEDHRKEKAIDGSDITFWADVFLTDEPIVLNYDGSEVYGALCEIRLQFFRKELINHIRFNPFSNYPLKVYKIKYRTSASQSWVDLGVPQQSSTQVMEFNFSEVEAKEVMIVINQENPSVNTYKIPKSVINNAQMWQQISDRELSISTETSVPIQATQDMIDYVTGWQAYQNAVSDYADVMKKATPYENVPTLGETIFDVTTNSITKASPKGADTLKLNMYGSKSDKVDELVEVRKYEYLYGAYEIDVKRIWYVDKGVYISPAYATDGSVLEAEIDVDEELPPMTSIEYSLSTDGKNWKNILPSGSYVSYERVDIDPISLRGILRFPTRTYLLDNVYRNQKPMPSGSYAQIDPLFPSPSGYYFDEGSNSVVVSSGWYLGTAYYTASYEPIGIGDIVPSGLTVDFSNDAVREAEDVFPGGASRNYKVELGHNPYIDWRIVNDTLEARTPASGFAYVDGRWLNISASEKYGIEPGSYYDIFTATVDGYPSENRTDYYNDIRPALTAYDKVQYPYYEYFQSGKNLYFNTKIESQEVKVKYNYLNDYVQFQAVLRNNNPANVTYTPMLNSYTLKLRTA